MDDVNDTDVRVERRGPSWWVVVDRPHRGNSITSGVLSAIGDAVRGADDDPKARAVVLTGSGDRVFCAGADLAEGTDNLASKDDPRTGFARLARELETRSTVLVARVNGACVAGGLGLLGLCDIVVASHSATFGLPETRVGVFPYQVFAVLQHRVRPGFLRYLALTGRRTEAPEAREAGLVDVLAAPGELDVEVDRLLEDLAAGAPGATAAGLTAVRAMSSMPPAAALEHAQARLALAIATNEAAEGTAAFRERRPAAWAVTERRS